MAAEPGVGVSEGAVVAVGWGVSVGRGVELGWAVKVPASMVPDIAATVAFRSGVGAGAGAGLQADNSIAKKSSKPERFIPNDLS